MKDKSIVFVVNSTSGGGAEVSAMTIFRELISVGYNVKVIAINQNQFRRDRESDSIIELGRRWKDGPFGTFSALIDFRRMLRKFSPELVVAHCELPEMFCAFMPISRTKLFAVEHTSNPWAGRKILGWLIRMILKYRQTEWITVNKSREKIWPFGTYPIYIANPASKNLILDPQRIPETIAFIGRLREEKRPHWAINAAIENGIAIAVVGEGDYKPILMEEYANHQGLVNFYGFMENPWSLLSPDTLIVMPSEFEGDGLVAVEAIINGFPIVLANNQDLRRFELPVENYFTTEIELIEILNKVKEFGTQNFAIPKSIITNTQNERDIRTIAAEWVRVLSLHSSGK